MKTAIVTGAAHGIGRGIVEKLLEEKCIVSGLDIKWMDENRIDHPNFQAYTCDVGKLEEVERTVRKVVERNGFIDYMVNNAGIWDPKPIDQLEAEEWNRILSVNLSSIFYLVKSAKPFLAKNSVIVNIASSRAIMSEANTEAYSASKGGVVALTHALAISLGANTRVNCVSPGWIEVNDYNSLSKEDHEQQPVGRVGKESDIAEMVAFLLNDDKAGFITGQHIVVDGGMTKKMIYT